jgi:alkane 1-monooxygenase
MRLSDLRFLLAVLLPLLTIYSLFQEPATAAMWTLIVLFIVILLDALLPNSSPEPSEQPSALSDAYFRWVLRLYVPLQMALIAAGTVLGIGFAVGFVTGSQGITFAHELGHSKSPFDRVCGWLLMSSVCYGHFMVEHYRGHHPRAATYEDPASARYGESLYRFLPRTVWGSLASGWRLEAQRLVQMKSSWAKSPLVWSTLASALMLLGPIFMQIMPFDQQISARAAINLIAYLIFQSFVAFVLLEIVNYIEHYGLQRQTQGNRREAFGMMHAWNADHIITNSLLANLQRHSDHHMHAWKHYSTLQAMPQGPQLPTGYAGCILLATIPPLWFALMHPRLSALQVAQQQRSA